MGRETHTAVVLFSLAAILLLGSPGLGKEEEILPTPAPVSPEPPVNVQPLTLGQLEQLALQSNPTLLQASADVEAARGRAIQAGMKPNPTIGYTGQQIGSAGRAGQQGIYFDQPIITGKKLALSYTAGLQEVNSARWSVSEQQFRVVNAVRDRYYRAVAAARLLEVGQKLVSTSEDLDRFGEELLKKKKIAEADLYNSRLNTEQVRNTLEDAKIRYQASLRQLMVYVGCPDLEAAALEDVLERPLGQYNFADTLNTLLANSPEVQRTRADVARYEWLLRRAVAEPIPNIDVQAGTQYDFASERQQANVQVGFTIPLYDKNQGGIREAEANLARARAEVRRTELVVRQRLGVTFRHYETASNDVRKYREDLLPKATKLLKMRIADVRSGKGQWSDLMDAERTWADMERNFVQRLLALRQAEVDLSSLLMTGGLDQPDGPSSDTANDNNGG